MAVNISISGTRALNVTGRLVAGESVRLEVTGGTPAALYLVDEKRAVVAACQHFEDGAGTINLATVPIGRIFSTVPAGRAVSLACLVEGESGGIIGYGFIPVVSAPMPDDLVDVDVDTYIRASDIRALFADIPTEYANQRSLSEALSQVVTVLKTLGLSVALALSALATEWQDVPANTVIGDGLTLTNGTISAAGGGTDGQAVTNIVEGIVRDGGYIAQEEDPIFTAWRGDDESTLPGLRYDIDWSMGKVTEIEEGYATKASLGTAAYADAADFATAADEALVYQLLMGSNVVAEVTNYNSRVRAPQLRLLQLDQDTKEYFTVWAETNGLTRTLNEAKAHTDAATNTLGLAKADRAWSKYTSGLGADAPAGVTWISTPETVVAGGYEYERHVTTHGEVWVLTSNGMGFGGDSNSYFRVSTPDGETLFSIEKTDEQIVGVLTDGITVSGGVVTLDVGVTTYNGQAPICMAAQSVSGPWSDLSEGRPAWISSVATNGVNGAWSFELESEASTAFFYFLIRQPGATVIKNSAQTNLSGGILVEGTRFYPHKSGSTLTWTTTP